MNKHPRRHQKSGVGELCQRQGPAALAVPVDAFQTPLGSPFPQHPWPPSWWPCSCSLGLPPLAELVWTFMMPSRQDLVKRFWKQSHHACDIHLGTQFPLALERMRTGRTHRLECGVPGLLCHVAGQMVPRAVQCSGPGSGCPLQGAILAAPKAPELAPAGGLAPAAIRFFVSATS